MEDEELEYLGKEVEDTMPEPIRSYRLQYFKEKGII